MHEDLRRRALESKKTLSRKARSRHSSATTSPVTSRAGSRAQSPSSLPTSKAASRAGSDEEFDDDMSTVSAFSIREEAEIEDNVDLRNWDNILQERIDLILDAKGRHQEDREKDLRVYIRILREHFARDDIYASISDLRSAFIKASRSRSDEEATQALKALQVTVVTDQSEDFYEPCEPLLKDLISKGDSFPVRAEAIRTLGIVTFYSAADEELTEEVMNYLLAIIDSDGCNIGADEDVDIVTAALETWGFLATQIDDMEDTSHEPMDAFVEQLHSSDARVQIAAGQNICLLYEKSYTPVEENEAIPRPPDYEDGDPVPYRIKRYDPYRKKHELMDVLEAMARDSHKSVAKKMRRELHTSFADFQQSVEDPTSGPRYRRPAGGAAEGRYADEDELTLSPRYRKTAKGAERRANALTVTTKTSNGVQKLPIDSWWKFLRVRELQRVLKQGFVEHYGVNEMLDETLSLGEERPAMPWGVHWAS